MKTTDIAIKFLKLSCQGMKEILEINEVTSTDKILIESKIKTLNILLFNAVKLLKGSSFVSKKENATLDKVSKFKEINDVIFEIESTIASGKNTNLGKIESFKEYQSDKIYREIHQIKVACANHFDLPTVLVFSERNVIELILNDIEKNGKNRIDIPWVPLREKNNRSTELHSRIAKQTSIKILNQKFHATPENMEKLIHSSNIETLKQINNKNKNGTFLFIGGTYGSGKSSSLEVEDGSYHPNFAMSADSVKQTIHFMGEWYEDSYAGINSTYNNLHHEGSITEYSARMKILEEKNIEKGSLIYDGSLGWTSDVEQALKAGKNVIIKYSIVPIQQSLIRVFKRTGISGPKIPFQPVMESYERCLNALKTLIELKEKNKDNMILEIYGPSFNHEDFLNDPESIRYQNGPMKNVYLSEPELINCLISYYEKEYNEIKDLAGKSNLTFGDVLKEKYFSPMEWKHIQSIEHMQMSDTSKRKNLKVLMDDHSKNKTQKKVKPSNGNSIFLNSKKSEEKDSTLSISSNNNDSTKSC